MIRLLAILAPVFLLQASAEADDDLRISRDGSTIQVDWKLEDREFGRLTLDATRGKPLIRSLGIASEFDGVASEIVKEADPVVFLRVGSREAPEGQPPGMSVFNVFFDNPAKRPFESFQGTFEAGEVAVEADRSRGSVTIQGLKAGPFSGAWRFKVYAGSRLLQIEAILKTSRDKIAFVYDAGLASASPLWNRFAWIDVEGNARNEPFKADAPDRAQRVRHRVLAVETPGGSIGCFPPPHQYFYPRDYSDNQDTSWWGSNHRSLESRQGFGIRQTETGGGNFVPWFNAPPNTEQRLKTFYLLTKGKAEHAIAETLKYTRSDRFAEIPGYSTFTSHWHLAAAEAAAREIATGKPRTVPDFVTMLKDLKVRAIHIAEFHGDGHPQDPGPLRLPELRALFQECERLSDGKLLVIPGEEANARISAKGAGRETGHWLDLFPKPVFWTMNHSKDQAFAEEIDEFGKVYHVGSPEDMLKLLREEKGLAWTAHPRIKGSTHTPDAYRDEAIYKSDSWLGGAWKAMPADLSREKLGERVLDLFDEMENWGERKYVLGEVDVFKVDRTHELYGHMNVNYLKLDKIPKFKEDWTPILDALRQGRFFVTTGEILLTDFQIEGKSSGETLKLPGGLKPELIFQVQGTFPLNFAEIISGDGREVFRERIDLSSTSAFASETIKFHPALQGKKWVRLEVWDIACNGAFTQPVWIEPLP